MARCVFVLPLNIICSVYADIHGESPMSRQFEMTHNKIVGPPIDGFEVELRFACDSSLVPEGHISLTAVGSIKHGDVEAERSCMMNMLQVIRNQLGIFPADYNYIAISEKRALFNAMKVVLDPARADYVEMAIQLSVCEAELLEITRMLSVWIGDNHPFVGLEDIEPVAAMHAVLLKQSDTLHYEKGYADRLCEAAFLRTGIPDGLALFDDSVPMPMNIDWENCCTTLCTIYKAVLKKIQAVPSTIRLHRLRGGEAYKAVVNISVAPFRFEGAEASTRKAALARLYYSVIKFVNVERRVSILDFHTEVREYQDAFIERFDITLDNVLKCGEKLNQLVRVSTATVNQCVADLAAKLDINEHTEPILDAVQRLSAIFAAKKLRVQEMWETLEARKTDKASLESQLAGGL